MAKVYKYIQLNDCEKIERFEKILLTNEIWLSKFSNLNDPMEGIYYSYDSENKTLNLLNEKNKYLIGCFGSCPDNFNLWAYYADGFRGACIEIELDNEYKCENVKYVRNSTFKKVLTAKTENLKTILTRKLIDWKKESECRLLVWKPFTIEGKGMNVNIGKITGVYFGLNIQSDVINAIKEMKLSTPAVDEINFAIYSPESINIPVAVGDISSIIAKLELYQEKRARYSK